MYVLNAVEQDNEPPCWHIIMQHKLRNQDNLDFEFKDDSSLAAAPDASVQQKFKFSLFSAIKRKRPKNHKLRTLRQISIRWRWSAAGKVDGEKCLYPE